MGEYKTPGVYIKEKNAFGNSVVEAETAIPVFIGLTEKAQDGTASLLNKPVRISSMTEYNKYFGGAKAHKFNLSVVEKAKDKVLSVDCGNKKLQAEMEGCLCTLYYHMVLFFANGGGTCYVVSIGDYTSGGIKDDVIKSSVLPELKKVQDITMLVVPEAVNVNECMNIYTDLLQLCDSKRYFALLDIPQEFTDEDTTDSIEHFRNKIGTANLQFAAAYYPWLETSVLSDNDINGETLEWISTPGLDELGNNQNLKNYFNDCFQKITDKKDGGKELNGAEVKQIKNDLHNALFQNWPLYQLLVKKVKDYLNHLPSSAAMAGVYTMVDNTRGVWKAPANVSISYVNKPEKPITDADQENLNMPMNGKAINAIRTFPGEGIKVWGARTLDGNSQDWRYINVRRTMSFLEVSVKNAARAYVFEPNDASTWINMRCMIENFLRSVWKRGGLAGSSPEDAYEVHIGLGDTMTPEDILEGIMRITVLVAISRPAEFIEITFQQQMQKS